MIAQVSPQMIEAEVSVLPDLEGMVQIFTAPHRNFFTNVVSQAIRNSAQGQTTLLIQFLKGGIGTGANRPVQLCQNLKWVRCGLQKCVGQSEISADEKAEILELWNFAKESVLSNAFNTVIFDELSLAMNFNLIPEQEVVELIHQRPRRLDLILAGPNIPESVLKIADQVTELRRNLYI